ncbi:MAG: signal peptidase II [Bacillota bacterium]
MKRPFIFGILILSFDQLLKWYFQSHFAGRRLILLSNWGFTYVTNPGIWLNKDISNSSMLIVQIYALSVWIYVLFMLRYYHQNYRKSIYVDLAFGFFTAAIYGNVIVDRLIFGYVRDFFINPIAVSNLADICGEVALVLVVVEFITQSKSRSVVKVRVPKD